MTPTTLAEALRGACARWPDRQAVVFGDRRMTYGELDRAAATLASSYRLFGVGRGDRVVCATPNHPEFVVCFVAACACGAVHVGVDHQLTPPELSTVLRLTGARVLICPPLNASGVVGALRRDFPDTRIVLTGDSPAPEGFLAFRDLLRAEVKPVRDSEGPRPEDPALLFITSGTTGTPKATVGYHANLCHRWHRLAGQVEFAGSDVHLAHLPLSHGFGLMMAVAGLLTGGKLILLERFSTDEALRTIGAEGVTVLNGAPAHFKLILGRLDPAQHDLRTLRLSVGTAALFPRQLVEEIWRELKVKFMFMYGSSEGVGVATTDPEDIIRGSVGRPPPGSVTIVGPDRTPVTVGEVGEVAFSRKIYPVRYWGDSSLTGDWYYSGDLGQLDAEGRLYVHGRLKHQIDRGGLKVDPVEVENAIIRCPGIADAAVIGLPHTILGETVCACVVPETGARPTLEHIRAALSGELADYKLPEQLCVLGNIPRTPVGKVDLRQLRVDASTRIESR
jgi:acyl-CoA synthetase (AMP-forming)/AMP-acid ligase II